MPSITPLDVTINPSSVNAGAGVTCTVTLNGTPTSDQTVQISTDHSSAFTNLPISIVVAANTNSKQFSVQTNSAFSGGTVNITASCNNGQQSGPVAISGSP